jgi:hypothetical protein
MKFSGAAKLRGEKGIIRLEVYYPRWNMRKRIFELGWIRGKRK